MLPETHAALENMLQPHGLVVLGEFELVAADGYDGNWRSGVLIGNAGPAMWRAFAAARPAGPDPLDRWSQGLIDGIAADLGGFPVYPFGGPPYAPFQQWAARAGGLSQAPLGPLVHPVYGTWFAFRGAIFFGHAAAPPAAPAGPAPCRVCIDKPCLTVCPVDAINPKGYRVEVCRDALADGSAGDCRARGCAARHACPVGKSYAYGTDQAAFHMAAFGRRGG